MYDELVKVLRDMSKMGMKYGVAVVKMREAADAIEQLIEERDAYRKAMTHEHNRAATLAWEKEHCWIPVKERLPEVRTWVLCFCRANSFDVFRMTEEGHWQYGNRSVYMKGYVTHWMPLPQSPKEESYGV